MTKKAHELLPEVLQIVESDLMKAHHYLDKALQVAMLASDMETAQSVAAISVGVSLYLKETTHTLKKLKEASL